MSELTIKQVIEWVKSNDLYTLDLDIATRVIQGKEIFVPSAHKYPHVHINKDFIVWSKNSGNHTDLIRGSMVYEQNIKNAQTYASDFGMDQLLRYMKSQA